MIKNSDAALELLPQRDRPDGLGACSRTLSPFFLRSLGVVLAVALSSSYFVMKKRGATATARREDVSMLIDQIGTVVPTPLREYQLQPIVPSFHMVMLPLDASHIMKDSIYSETLNENKRARYE